MHLHPLITQIENNTAIIGIIGLGYVGLPLAIAFSKKFTVIGFDINQELIKNLEKGKSHIQDISDEELQQYIGKSFIPSYDEISLQRCDFVIICVPTPLEADHTPDLSYIKNSAEIIRRNIKSNQFVILESTTYPGTTDEILIPILEESGLCAGSDFGVAYSPERIDPGNKHFTIETTPKIVGGINEICTIIASNLYGSIIDKVIKVHDTKTAESVKMMENIFRNVNIALVNELSLIYERMGINIWDVIDAASSKPYGFMAFYPGPGVGGHCIPLDPYYLSYKSKKLGIIPRFIDTSGEINEFMKIHVINLAELGLKKVGKKIYKANIAIIGLSYKKNIDDIRESPSIGIIEELVRVGANIRVYDPFITTITTSNDTFNSAPDIVHALENADCALFLIDHDRFREISKDIIIKYMASPVVIDAKNILQDVEGLIYLGIGKPNF